MPSYYIVKTKIKTEKTATEMAFLVDACSTIDAEKRTLGTLTNDGYQFADLEITHNVLEKKSIELLNQDAQLSEYYWYLAQVELQDLEPDTQQTKAMKKYFFIKAQDFGKAHDLLTEELDKFQIDSEILKVEKHKIVEVIRYQTDEYFPDLPKEYKTVGKEEV